MRPIRWYAMGPAQDPAAKDGATARTGPRDGRGRCRSHRICSLPPGTGTFRPTGYPRVVGTRPHHGTRTRPCAAWSGRPLSRWRDEGHLAPYRPPSGDDGKSAVQFRAGGADAGPPAATDGGYFFSAARRFSVRTRVSRTESGLGSESTRGPVALAP